MKKFASILLAGAMALTAMPPASVLAQVEVEVVQSTISASVGITGIRERW